MRKVFLFLTRHYFFILFLFLESLSVFLIIQNNHFHRAHFLNSSNTVAGNILETWSGITGYFALKEKNENLAEENAALRNQVRQSLENYSSNPVLVKDSSFFRKYLFISAKVVNNSTGRRKNFITINRGKKQGVRPGMGVISGLGVVGIIRDVSDNFSTAMSVLHQDMRVPVVIRKFGENSILTWNGHDPSLAQLERIASHLALSKGDTIVTSAYSSVFPQGIMAGTIDGFEKISGNTFYEVSVKLSVNFNRLNYVQIVNNLMQEEQQSLEKKQEYAE